jgi:hypothetical protein|tara:strand:- start:8 stop:187 length:180 start_codon:yes stop_codon:yes gene_type:complete
MKIKSVKKDKDFMTNNFNNVYVLTLENDKVWYVPKDETNTDYQEVLKWVAEGNTIAEAD